MVAVKVRFDGHAFFPEEPVELPAGSVREIYIDASPVQVEDLEVADDDVRPLAALAEWARTLPPYSDLQNDQLENHDDSPAPVATMSELVDVVNGFPVNPDLPPDGAEQHDHYLYGTPKRT